MIHAAETSSMDWYKNILIANTLDGVNPAKADIVTIRNVLSEMALQQKNSGQTNEQIASNVIAQFKRWIGWAYHKAFEFYESNSGSQLGSRRGREFSSILQVMREKASNGMIPPEQTWPKIPSWAVSPETKGISVSQLTRFLNDYDGGKTNVMGPAWPKKKMPVAVPAPGMA